MGTDGNKGETEGARGREERPGQADADESGVEGKAAGSEASKGRSPQDAQEKPVRSSAARIPSPRPGSDSGGRTVRKLHATGSPERRPTGRRAQGGEPRARRSGTPDRAVQDIWVARLREGDPEALREVVAAFGERLTAVVSGILRDRDAVDDVVQETFAKAFYRIASFKGGSSLYTWLYRVAVNASKDYIKSRRRRPASSFDDLPGRASLPAGAPPMMEGLERRELRLAVRDAIAKLPRRFRNVLALREIEGMAYNEIAEVLGLSLGTVESRLFRARKRLKALLLVEDPSSPSERKRVERKGQDS